MAEPGQLILVPTPLGNIRDMSPRAQEVLAAADLIACEDTRVTARLLAALHLPEKELLSYHEHNEQARVQTILSYLAAGRTIAQVTDAGMPAISDPGEILVKACVEAGYDVFALPGPNAALTALAASGLTTRYFYFEGFLPASGAARKERLQTLLTREETIILYEAPHRLAKTLVELQESGLGERKLCLARELSKRYETYLRCSVREAVARLEREAPRGEYVLVLEGSTEFLQRRPEELAVLRERECQSLREDLHMLQELGLPARKMAAFLQKHHDFRKNEIYKELKKL